MNWQTLLNPMRIRKIQTGEDSHKHLEDFRSEFQRDYDRSLFSTPVRRLQDKAQVFPLEPHDAVRTRLTHSLEVSNVARGLAMAVTNWLHDTGRLKDSELLAAIQLIAATCGLIHDLGNPPFGHSGEDSIRERPEYARQLEQDFRDFEGNAQTLRIVSKLQVLSDYFGLNLTAGTMSAACKYTASSDEADRDSKIHEKTKPGFFASEHQLIQKIRDITGTGENRNPITFLVEAADDIVYSVVDIEDGIKKNALSWKEVETRVKERSYDALPVLEAILKDSADYIKRADPPLVDRDFDEGMSQIFRSFAINAFTKAAVDAFKHNYDAIMEGSFHGELIKESVVAPLVKELKRTARECIFRRDASILEREIAGRRVIYDLMDMFWESVCDFTPPDSHKTDMGSKIYSLISPNYRRVFNHALKTGTHPPDYYKMQLVTDYVCGMTDSFATRLHAKLTNG